MKLCRIGDLGVEKPALIDNENNYRDKTPPFLAVLGCTLREGLAYRT